MGRDSKLPAHQRESLRAATIDHPKLRTSKLTFGVHEECYSRKQGQRAASASATLKHDGRTPSTPFERHQPQDSDQMQRHAGGLLSPGRPGTHHATPLAELEMGRVAEAQSELTQILSEDAAINSTQQPILVPSRDDSVSVRIEEHLHVGRSVRLEASWELDNFREHGRPSAALGQLESAPESEIQSGFREHLGSVRRKRIKRHRHHHHHHNNNNNSGGGGGGGGGGEKDGTSKVNAIEIDPWIAELVRQQNIRDHGVYHHASRVASSYPFRIVCAVLLWLAIGTIFYHFNSGFRIPQAFFYTIQAGLSVGYGANGVTCKDADDLDACNYFTSAQVVLTSALISSALSVYLDAVICDSFNEWEEVKREIIHRYRDNNESTAQQRRADRDGHERTVVSRLNSNYDAPTYPESGQDCEVKPELRAFALLSRPWKTLVRASRVPYIQMSIVVGLIVLCGLLWASLEADMPFSSALLFAVTSLSTGGLTSPDAEKDSVSWFVAFYCLVGIPMYAGLIGAVAGCMTTRRNRSLLRDRLHSSISGTDIMCMSALHGHHDDHFDYADYLSLQLIKLGAVSPATIGKIQAHFIEMDDNNTGTLSRDQLLVEHAFDSVDTSKLGVIDRREFAQLCAYLAKCGNSQFGRIVHTKEMFQSQFEFLATESKRRKLAADKARGNPHGPDHRVCATDDFITRQVFCQWWIAIKRKARMEADVLDALTSDHGHPGASGSAQPSPLKPRAVSVDEGVSRRARLSVVTSQSGAGSPIQVARSASADDTALQPLSSLAAVPTGPEAAPPSSPPPSSAPLPPQQPLSTPANGGGVNGGLQGEMRGLASPEPGGAETERRASQSSFLAMKRTTRLWDALRESLAELVDADGERRSDRDNAQPAPEGDVGGTPLPRFDNSIPEPGQLAKRAPSYRDALHEADTDESETSRAPSR